MPPTFAYILALMLYGLSATAIWTLSLFLAFVPRTRLLSCRLSLAMLLSFPSVFIYQIAAFPFVVLTFIIVILPFRFFQFIHSSDAIVLFLAVLVLIGGFAAASIAGFVDGWNLGWKVAGSIKFTDALKETTANRIRGTIIRRIRNR